jgi:hypothetical protein
LQRILRRQRNNEVTEIDHVVIAHAPDAHIAQLSENPRRQMIKRMQLTSSGCFQPAQNALCADETKSLSETAGDSG